MGNKCTFSASAFHFYNSQNICEEPASVSEGYWQSEAGGGAAGHHGAVLKLPEAGHREAEECEGRVQEEEGQPPDRGTGNIPGGE